ncbi:MAG TPA: ABC transporter substrate-binding protein [Microthrixaceae bacterium]|nr:ABC transporter substrate-binding protein [Microthrixaceae bacterium]
MKRWFLVLLAVVALVASACGASGDDNASDEEEESSSQTDDTSSSGSVTKFGTMDSPCGPDVDGTKITIKADEAGTGADKLYLGIANERTAEARPGLLQEMYDASFAFMNWCNEQGGIGGMEIVPVDLDGQLFKIEAAMTTACSQTFAMVGGGYAQDNQVFTGKDGSDFHKCKMIAFPGFAVSTEFAEANGVVQPIPNLAYVKPKTWFEDLVKLYPDEMAKTTVVYGEGLPSIRINKDQNKATASEVDGIEFVDDVSYALLNQDFSVTAQKVIDLGATSVNFIGEPENYSSLLRELETKGYEGITFSDANEYDELLFSKGPSEGAMVRIVIHPFEEADEWPATRQFLDALPEFGPPNAKLGSLGVQSWSAGLLFATAVNDCAKESGGEISRECVVNAGKAITEWDGGGLHAPTDPSKTTILESPACSLLVQAQGGEFVRLHPELDGEDDTGDGFHCLENGHIEIEGDFGQGNVDDTLPY